MNERHKGQLKLAHNLYDNRDLKQELIYQREFLDTGYLSYQQVCFNKWIFDESLKRLEKLEKIKQIVKQVESLHPEVAIGDREGIRKIKEVLEQDN